jgi:hypothetical protein
MSHHIRTIARTTTPPAQPFQLPMPNSDPLLYQPVLYRCCLRRARRAAWGNGATEARRFPVLPHFVAAPPLPRATLALIVRAALSPLVDYALAGDRLIGTAPAPDAGEVESPSGKIFRCGAWLRRAHHRSAKDDGRLMLSLTGISRLHVVV